VLWFGLEKFYEFDEQFTNRKLHSAGILRYYLIYYVALSIIYLKPEEVNDMDLSKFRSLLQILLHKNRINRMIEEYKEAMTFLLGNSIQDQDNSEETKNQQVLNTDGSKSHVFQTKTTKSCLC